MLFDILKKEIIIIAIINKNAASQDIILNQLDIDPKYLTPLNNILITINVPINNKIYLIICGFLMKHSKFLYNV